ncbi:MAG TPA: DUF3943 domain-containing protein, partial [Burkholderiales bacterium]|nr:DUF3943 domain-containing protein [Burkholderiales bacterium]
VIRRLAFGAAIVLGGAAAGAFAAEDPTGIVLPQLDESGLIEAHKSYWIPALEIIGFDLLLNQFNRRYFEGDDFSTSASSVKRNLESGWVVDGDPYDINQLGHPYQGSMYHGFARSAGLGYWPSLAYTFAGSWFWEIAGETTAPSINDQIASGIGGSFLGEALFRMSSLVLEKGTGVPRFWRELGAAVVSPPTGFNRLAFGERFDTVFSSRNPAYYSRFSLALSGTTQNDPGTSTKLERGELLADFSLDYGLPGKPGYAYRRPFDYFAFQITASSANAVENVLLRGLLLGDEYQAGRSYRGVWGLYGSYDYIAPQIYRVSSTAVSLGTTAEWRLSRTLSLQGTALAGAGYAAVGTMQGSSDEYHYGIAPQALLALRLIFGDRASLDLTGREYFVGKAAAADIGGHDNIVRVDAALTVRLYRQQAVAVRYLHNRRDASFPAGDLTQTRATLGIFYVMLGHDRFGTFDWR